MPMTRSTAYHSRLIDRGLRLSNFWNWVMSAVKMQCPRYCQTACEFRLESSVVSVLRILTALSSANFLAPSLLVLIKYLDLSVLPPSFFTLLKCVKSF